MRRVLIAAAAFLAAVVVLLLATLPPAPARLAENDPALGRRTIAGALHVHSTVSDGGGDYAAVAAAASRAGLQFVVFTDHGDGTSPRRSPEYLNGVLCLTGVEISTDGGHYLALDMRPSTYPLGGHPAAVVEDVARLGGFGVVAHPDSAKPALAWTGWSEAFDGVEWLNADSEWRDERPVRLARTLFDYFVRPGPALGWLLDRPQDTLVRWDHAAAARRILAFAGHDAHGGIGRRSPDDGDDGEAGGFRVGIPSYEASFRTFSTRVILDRPLEGHAERDGIRIIDALKAGRSFTVVDSLAAPTTLQFSASTDAGQAFPGDVLPPVPARFEARVAVPDGAAIQLMHNGNVLARASGGVLEADAAGSGAYRIEVSLPGAPGAPPIPWLVSNPIFLLPPDPQPPVEDDFELVHTPVTVVPGAWQIEHEPSSGGTISTIPGGIALDYRLGEGSSRSQYVALAADIARPATGYDRIVVEARSPEPMRASVQLRLDGPGDQRWRKSIYLDSTWQRITIPVEQLAPAATTNGPPDRSAVRSILVVVDLTNARPGDAGRIEVGQVSLAASPTRR
jgi:hypothetical protein